MGADCIANNLHFHLVYADSMFEQFGQKEAYVFPIEQSAKKLFFKSELKHKDPNEMNMYSCPVRFGELPDWPLKTLILSPDVDGTKEDGEDISLEDAQEALSHTAGIVLNYLIELNIPHNILIADEGMTIYIIPRKFDLLIEGVSFFTSFESLCGFIKCKTQDSYNSMDYAQINQHLRESVSVLDTDFEKMKNDLVEKFMKEYEGNRI